jgi:hypothetical protein
VKLKPFKRAPLILALAVLACVCGLRLLNFDFFERLELMTYDQRTRAALHFPAPEATNLAFVSIEESSIAAVKNGSVGFHFGLYWPRSVYGRLVGELSDEGAKAVAFDLLFTDLRSDLTPVQMADASLIESDDYFAMQMRRAGNTILATAPETILPELFATNAAALGDISAVKDSDGIFRRIRALNTIRRWHPIFLKRRGFGTCTVRAGQNHFAANRDHKCFHRPDRRANEFCPRRFCRKQTATRPCARGQSLHRRTRLAHGHRPRGEGTRS